jgi:hypothetical protein
MRSHNYSVDRTSFNASINDLWRILPRLLSPPAVEESVSTHGRSAYLTQYVKRYRISAIRLQCAASLVEILRRHGTPPTLTLVADLLHQLFHTDRTEETDARIDDLAVALAPLLPPGHSGPSVYRRAGSIQQLPLEITLHIFRYLSPPDMKAFCRSHRAAFKCLHDRKIASRMLQDGVIRPDQIGKCSAVTVGVLQLVEFHHGCQGHEALESAANGDRLDLATQLLHRYSFSEHAMGSVLCASARAKNVELFSVAVNRMSHATVIDSLAKCRDRTVFHSPLVVDLLRSLTASETRDFLRHASISNNDEPVSAITRLLCRDLNQEAVDCIYKELLCDHSEIVSTRLQRHHHIDALMSAERFPVGGALERCVKQGDEFFDRYMRRWPLDRAAVIAALKRQLKLGRDSENSLTGERFDSNIAFLLTHSERPDWSQILGILRSFDVDDDVVWHFVNAVESLYDISTMESTCSADDNVALLSTYFPQAVPADFSIKAVSKILENGEITAAQLPAFLEQDGDRKSLFYRFRC